MKKEQTVYKVIKSDLGGLYSAIVDAGHPIRVRYKMNNFVSPKLSGSKLLAFRTLKDAKIFCKTFIRNDRRIFKALGQNVDVQVDIASLFSHAIAFWNNAPVMRMSAPTGTVGCSAIKLIKEMKGGKK